jgi:signal transduction histidine kinase
VKRLSLRWKLILLAESVAVIATLVVGTTVYLGAERRLLGEIANSLAHESQEVLTVLEDPDSQPTIEDYLEIQTSHRLSPYTYLYQIRNIDGSTLARSDNFAQFPLPLPNESDLRKLGHVVRVTPVSKLPTQGRDPLVIWTARVDVNLHGRERKPLIIQTAAFLEAWTANLRNEGVGFAILAVSILAGVFLLIWGVTTLALRPVSMMTRKAAQIGGKNVEDRIPISGRGDELDELAGVLNGMLDRLSESLRQTAQFSSAAAHQLRTPLTRIRGRLELMLLGEIPPSLRGDIEICEEEMVRLSNLCARLLLLGRLELRTGEANILSTKVDVSEIAKEIVEQCSPAAQDQRVTLLVQAPAPAWVHGSRVLLVEALLNLLDNAIRATPAGGTIGVSVATSGAETILSVADTGGGIPEHERERVFQPFHRGGEGLGTEVSEGSGLGLAIVRAIARAHLGRIELAPPTGSGCVFRLILSSAA